MRFTRSYKVSTRKGLGVKQTRTTTRLLERDVDRRMEELLSEIAHHGNIVDGLLQAAGIEVSGCDNLAILLQSHGHDAGYSVAKGGSDLSARPKNGVEHTPAAVASESEAGWPAVPAASMSRFAWRATVNGL
jgi:hypothetical protein